MRLQVVPGRYAISRLDAEADLPSWPRGLFVSITRTDAELSIVCDEASVPGHVKAERGWRCLRAHGPIPFETTGVAASLTSPLAAAAISILLVSTFDTDYLLVKDSTFELACNALRAVGHEVGL